MILSNQIDQENKYRKKIRIPFVYFCIWLKNKLCLLRNFVVNLPMSHDHKKGKSDYQY